MSRENADTEPGPIYLVAIQDYEETGVGAYSTKDAALKAKEWFEEQSHPSQTVEVIEIPVNSGFEPPESFHANYLAWGYENGE